MDISDKFDYYFEELTGYGPFPWQAKLFREFAAKDFGRKNCPIPTGLGKTSIIAIWILALAHHAQMHTVDGVPRRLVYVVNRRTVVDQSTSEAERMLDALINKPELQKISDALRNLQIDNNATPLAISTLRGQFADNGEWRNDPARPAVVVGTVDMIGSRLLFSGYGCGFKTRPLNAGFLGQDSLLVHDEAHLEPAFQELIRSIALEQDRCHEYGRLRVMELTATSRSQSVDETLLFTDEDVKHPEARKRMNAKKWVKLHAVDSKTKIADKVVHLAKGYKDSNQAILIFLRELKEVMKVADALRKVVSREQVQTLTGTMRGWERDQLAKEDPVFARFVRSSKAAPQTGTVYLICTSAGEVGVNISADHLLCDLTPLDSMIQRFGRVNRFGDGDALIDVVYIEPSKDKAPTSYDHACEQTLKLLSALTQREKDQRYDASPVALKDKLPDDKQAAFTPPPVIRPATDILFDAWALTSIRQKLPVRPPVADWLHGLMEWEPPVTHVAWREEVEIISDSLLNDYKPEELIEDYPLKPHELLRDRTDRVLQELEKIAGRCPEKAAWLIDQNGKVEVLSLYRLVTKDKRWNPVMDLSNCTVLLSPAVGGFQTGMLHGVAAFDETAEPPYDIGDRWFNENSDPRRCRVWDDQQISAGMRLVRTIDTRLESEDYDIEESNNTSRRYWYWYVMPRSTDDDGSGTARAKQELEPHHNNAEKFAQLLVKKLQLKDTEATAVIMAARWHDLGKARLIWQRSIGNHDYPQSYPLAKSGLGMKQVNLSNYRHEFGSLIDLTALPEFRKLPMDIKDLVLHLVASHHGRARPYFSDGEAFDHERPDSMASEIASEIPRRFARLQRRYGRWGLAYLESLIRAADILASQAGNHNTSTSLESMPKQGGAK